MLAAAASMSASVTGSDEDASYAVAGLAVTAGPFGRNCGLPIP
jgi:hypothetical protein